MSVFPENTFKVLAPNPAISESILTSSNIAEPDTDDGALWLTGTSYSIGDVVYYEHIVYKAATANSAKQPDLNTSDWVKQNPTNRYKMFSNSTGYQSEKSGGISIQVTSGKVVNAVALSGVEAESVRVRLIDSVAGTVYDQTQEATERPDVYGWYSYYFAGFSNLSNFLFTDIPALSSAVIHIDLITTETAKCGQVVIGQVDALGVGIFGTGLSINDYSVKDTDDFGQTQLTKRSASNTMELDFRLATGTVNRVRTILTSLRATPCVWIGDATKKETIIFGWFKEFDLVLADPKVSEGSITIEELTV